jgi:hypothetical protein
MLRINFEEILDYGLRSQLAYAINQAGWYITERVGWRSPSTAQLIIKETSISQVNVLIEADHTNKIQWIAVRGSSNFKNWILDVEYIQSRRTEDCPDDHLDISLHSGFHKAADEVYQLILPHLRQDYQTRITGHSLGGAIAVILMILLQRQGYSIEKCITFGQPKVTNADGAKSLQQLPLLRVVNHEDIVPCLPPTTLFSELQGNYEHFGSEVILNYQTYTCPQSFKSNNHQADSFWGNLFRAATQRDIKNSTESIQDHNLFLYLLNVVSNLESEDPDLEKFLCEFVSPICGKSLT